MKSPVDIKNLHTVNGMFMLKMKAGTVVGPIVSASVNAQGMPLAINYTLTLVTGETVSASLFNIESGWII